MKKIYKIIDTVDLKMWWKKKSKFIILIWNLFWQPLAVCFGTIYSRKNILWLFLRFLFWWMKKKQFCCKFQKMARVLGINLVINVGFYEYLFCCKVDLVMSTNVMRIHKIWHKSKISIVSFIGWNISWSYSSYTQDTEVRILIYYFW